MLGYRVGRNARKCHLLAIAILENVVRAALVSEACRLPHFFCVSVDCRRERVCMYLRVRSYTFLCRILPGRSNHVCDDAEIRKLPDYIHVV